ncbi:DUF6989 domain-containing protein [Leptospira sp. GIMC2001]|uniref:DUF6989 domain-containing protein n=1 Tax=Leptospira sp. GIMC2001 TaxID=1513297 RepID=UPI002349DB62|nr:hypothetical protein [Leptospira sp. GIMC2001]WCL49042.1 hypothetical protein O4O04_17390 [Leptospira sp. GIMC2001]
MSREIKIFIVYLISFSILCGLVLFAPNDVPTGFRMFFLVVVFIISTPLLIKYANIYSWRFLFGFSLLVSIFQVLPDWFLSQVLGVLIFPDDGFPKIGTVSAYMAGLWTIPLFISVVSAQYVHEKLGGNLHIITGFIALAIFWISEETMHMIPVWIAKDVELIGSAAIYVLPAEFMLGVFFSYILQQAKFAKFTSRVVLAFSVSIFYTGALSFFYLMIQG